MGAVDNVVETFEAKARSAARHKAAYERELAEMYEMLPDLRIALKEDPNLPASRKGPKAIEEMARGLIPRDTASRRTAAAVGRSRKKADD